MITLRPANPSDIPAALNICSEARSFQRVCDNIQWADDYPSEDVITRDVLARKGYIAELDGLPAGYCVIDTDGDVEYDRASRLWHTNEPYVAVHRLAIADFARGKRLSVSILVEVERIIRPLGFRVIKVDTGLKNTPMHRLLASLGFSERGSYTFPWGPRLAYEKIIGSNSPE